MTDKFYQSAASVEWYTPAYLIEAARGVLGDIDLDPASCALANETVRAARYFDEEMDGLRQPWVSRAVWMNPPYGRGIGPFIHRLAEQYRAGNVGEAITLVPARTDTRWFQPLWGADALCFVKGRLHYPQSTVASPFPSCLGYFGPRPTQFAAVFGAFGAIRLPHAEEAA